MNDPTSLDNLHDIVTPPSVPLWPLAPGWYVVMLLIVCLLGWIAFRSWKQWRANAYRRAALRELDHARAAPDIAEVLKRAALSMTSRETIASLTATQWIEWLARTSPEEMPHEVCTQLVDAVYRHPGNSSDVSQLRAYAAAWIRHHRVETTSDT